MLELGPCKGLITGHSSCVINGKEAIRLGVAIVGEDQPQSVTIFLTDKSMGMARAQLKACGFDCDNQSLGDIDVSPPCLAGNEVSLIAEEYNGKLRLSIDLNKRIDKNRLDSLSQALRDVKKNRDDAPRDAGKQPDRHAGRPASDFGDIPFALLLAASMAIFL